MDKVVGNYTSQENRSFPLDCETLEAIQNNIDMLAALGNMVGDKTILSGCQLQSGGGRAEGYVFLKTTAYPMGEVLHFAGTTAASDYLHLVTQNSDVTQGDVTYNGAYTTRQVAPGTGTEQWAWSELTEPVDIEAIATELRQQMAEIQTEMAKINQVPLGVVEMYSGTTIPENYAVCDGHALSQALYADLYEVIGTRFNKPGTADGMFCLPDLSGRFVVGQSGSDTDFNTVGNTGGEKTHKLTEAEMPAHTHKVRVTAEGTLNTNLSDDGGNLSGVFSSAGKALGCENLNENYYDGLHTKFSLDKTYTSESTGGGTAHQNCPPYFVLYYIMRLK